MGGTMMTPSSIMGINYTTSKFLEPISSFNIKTPRPQRSKALQMMEESQTVMTYSDDDIIVIQKK